VLNAFRTRQRTLALSPTATGKTFCMLSLAAHVLADGNRVLMVVPAHLVAQTIRTARQWGFVCDYEKGDHYAQSWSPLVVASVDTLVGDRLTRWDPEAFAMITVDEAHHSVAPTWSAILDHFGMAKVVGLTATPDRSDAKSILDVFEDVCYEYTIQEAIADGYLAPLKQRFARVDGLDMSKVRKGTRDLSMRSEAKLVNNAEMIKAMADVAIREMGDRRTLVYCTTVAHAYAFSEYLKHRGLHAAVICGDTKKCPKRQRERIEEDFERGVIRWLCNVDCLTEGWDCPPTAGIVFARHTESRAWYAQAVGRGLRLDPRKQDCLVLDFVGNSDHRLVHSAHVLDPTISDEQAQIASKIIEDNPEVEIQDAIQLAFDKIQARILTTGERLAAKVKELGDEQADYTVEEVDPFDKTHSAKVLRLLHQPKSDDPFDLPASDEQVEALKRFGVRDPDKMNRATARRMLKRLEHRAEQKRATLRQAQKLISAGTHPDNAMAMSFARAQQGIAQLAQNGWRRPPEWGPRHDEAHPKAREYAQQAQQVED